MFVVSYILSLEVKIKSKSLKPLKHKAIGIFILPKVEEVFTLFLGLGVNSIINQIFFQSN